MWPTRMNLFALTVRVAKVNYQVGKVSPLNSHSDAKILDPALAASAS